MFKLPLLILGLTGCGPGGDGLGEVQSTDDAPWSMDAASTFLWHLADDNDGATGSSALFISLDRLDCSNLGLSAEGVRERKRGLVFELGYLTHKDPDAAPPSWDGLYLTGGADSLGQVVERTLSVEGWKDGSVYSIDGESWIQVDEGNHAEFRGTFATPWWRGAFSAIVCSGSATVGSGADTGE